MKMENEDQSWKTEYGRPKMVHKRFKTKDGRPMMKDQIIWKIGNQRWETKDGRQNMGDRRWETEDGRLKT